MKINEKCANSMEKPEPMQTHGEPESLTVFSKTFNFSLIKLYAK